MSAKIVYITAGAGGMYCGSCLRDNALATGLGKLGWDVTLLPLYTPIRVDGEDRSVDRVFFGGINVYLQQKIPLFRHLPAFLDHWLDNPRLIRRVASKSLSVEASELGAMTLSMVKGEHGFQRKEVGRLVRWLAEEAKPDLVCLTNLLVGGSLPAIKRELGVPVLVTLQGDDLFLDELEEPWHGQVLEEMRKLAAEADGFLTFSEFYRDAMSKLFRVPEEKFHLTPLGIDVGEFDSVHEQRERDAAETGTGDENDGAIGYFARICPEKGFGLVVDGFLELAARRPGVRLKAGGWLPEKDRKFFNEQVAKIKAAGLEDRFEYIGAPDEEGKLAFFRDVRVFCVPARFEEPKGLYVLEAMACGLPVVAPDRGPFPEMIRESGGGALFAPGDAADLATALDRYATDAALARETGRRGRRWVEWHSSRERMAEVTAEVFEKVLGE